MGRKWLPRSDSRAGAFCCSLASERSCLAGRLVRSVPWLVGSLAPCWVGFRMRSLGAEKRTIEGLRRRPFSGLLENGLMFLTFRVTRAFGDLQPKPAD